MFVFIKKNVTIFPVIKMDEKTDFYIIETKDDFDLEKIFECGQCFRWNQNEDGSYTGVAMGKAARIWKDENGIYITGNKNDYDSVWYDYFDMGNNYAEIRKGLCIDDYMKSASDFGAGIRILRQDKWEALCSFIISQCNNIPRIKKIVETLCRLFGDEIQFEGSTYYSFPSAETVSGLTLEDLSPLRCGYRAPYILDAACAVASGKLDLDALSSAPLSEAVKSLRSVNGVGEQVANCAILFSLHKLDAFPIDVWMKKAIAEHYGKDFDPAVFGDYAGIGQQYMFYYQRSGKN